MATYKYFNLLDESKSKTFDDEFEPNTATPFSGIYRCTGCKHEIVSTKNHPLPPQNHHQHTSKEGPIRWKLIVAAHHQTIRNAFGGVAMK